MTIESTSGRSRKRVLAALRDTSPQWSPLPDPRPRGASVALSALDRADAFTRVLQQAGGTVMRIDDEAALASSLETYPPFSGARRIVSGVDVLGSRGQDAVGDASPHSFADVDLTVARGAFGVAENGAVWCDGRGLPHRATYFLCQHLVLLVSASEIVDTLHEAYDRLGSEKALCRGKPWSGFIAGPSKTADIEQALVVGAHGPRSHLVVLVG